MVNGGKTNTKNNFFEFQPKSRNFLANANIWYIAHVFAAIGVINKYIVIPNIHIYPAQSICDGTNTNIDVRNEPIKQPTNNIAINGILDPVK